MAKWRAAQNFLNLIYKPGAGVLNDLILFFFSSRPHTQLFLSRLQGNLLVNGEIRVVFVPEDEVERVEGRRRDVARKFGRPPAEHRDSFQFGCRNKRKKWKLLKSRSAIDDVSGSRSSSTTGDWRRWARGEGAWTWSRSLLLLFRWSMRFPPTLQCPPRLRLLSSTMGLRTTDVATYREIVSPLSFPALRDVDNKDTARPITTTLCMHSLVCVSETGPAARCSSSHRRFFPIFAYKKVVKLKAFFSFRRINRTVHLSLSCCLDRVAHYILDLLRESKKLVQLFSLPLSHSASMTHGDVNNFFLHWCK